MDIAQYLEKSREINKAFDLESDRIRKMLDAIFIKSRDQKITVSLMMDELYVGSRATCHSALKRLSTQGYISVKSLPSKDGRLKYIKLTKKAHAYYKHLSEVL
ncbi:hypothetical protein [Polynucleobacter sp.]|jgi:DNA-binding MarR family transcriptional regulator|uniref:hypothetical protein n=1 Tax=Polynucleobacter sp. TaxID=2029855 RepID=UPI0037C6C453